jgi:acyl carrier protein
VRYISEQDDSEIIAQVVAALGDHVTGEIRVTRQTRIARDLELDSVAVMDFVMDLEDRFDISIPLERIAEIETVGDLCMAIGELRKGAA